jgi:hypothetical protein
VVDNSVLERGWVCGEFKLGKNPKVKLGQNFVPDCKCSRMFRKPKCGVCGAQVVHITPTRTVITQSSHWMKPILDFQSKRVKRVSTTVNDRIVSHFARIFDLPVVHFSGVSSKQQTSIVSTCYLWQSTSYTFHTQPLQHYRASNYNQPRNNHPSISRFNYDRRTRINKASTYALPFIPSTAKVR